MSILGRRLFLCQYNDYQQTIVVGFKDESFSHRKPKSISTRRLSQEISKTFSEVALALPMLWKHIVGVYNKSIHTHILGYFLRSFHSHVFMVYSFSFVSSTKVYYAKSSFCFTTWYFGAVGSGVCCVSFLSCVCMCEYKCICMSSY